MIPTIYFLCERLVLKIHNGAAALFQGITLALFDNDGLERLTERRYSERFASYETPPYVNSGFLIWERDAIDSYFPKGGQVLVAAAGAGREMIALSNAGFKVSGFDCCQPLVESGQKLLKQHQIDAVLEYARPSTVPSSQRQHDAALVGFSGYMYIPGRDRRIRFLKDLSALVKPNSPVMISFIEGSVGARRSWTARIGTTLRRLRRADPVEEGDCLKDGFQHHFLREQIQSEMNEAGLDLVFYNGGTCYGHAVGLVREE